MGYKTIVEDDIDILVAGAGLGGTGAVFCKVIQVFHELYKFPRNYTSFPGIIQVILFGQN